MVEVNESTRTHMHARVRWALGETMLASIAVHRPSLCPHHPPRCALVSYPNPPRPAKIESSYLSQPSLDMAASWKSLQSGFADLNLGQSANKLSRGLSSTVQATKERLGQVAAEDITELPQGRYIYSRCSLSTQGYAAETHSVVIRIQRSRSTR